MKKKFEVIDSLLGEAEENQSETQTPTAGERPTGEFGKAINDKSEVVYPEQKRAKGRPRPHQMCHRAVFRGRGGQRCSHPSSHLGAL